METQWRDNFSSISLVETDWTDLHSGQSRVLSVVSSIKRKYMCPYNLTVAAFNQT